MKKLFALALCLLTSLSGVWSAEPDYLSLIKAIPTQKLQHPYLVFDNQSKQEILRLVETDPQAAEIMEMIRVAGERYMLTTPDVEPPFVAEKLRARYIGGENPNWNYRHYYLQGAETLAFLYQMYGDEAYAQKAYYMIDKICALDTWIQKAHDFVNIYGRVWPWGAQDDQVVFSYDHTTGDYGVEVALVYDWLYPALNKYQRNRIRGALLEKVITKVRGCYEYHWWSTAYRCNWSGICHSGAGMAALTLLTEDPQLVDVVARACEGVAGMIGQIGIDGGWAEGRGYWAYGFGTSSYFMDAIKRATDSRINLFELPGIKNTPTDFALFALGGPFCDGGQIGPVGATHTHNKLVAETKNTTGKWYLENIQDQSINPDGPIWWNLIWPTPKDVPAVKPAEASKHFRTIDWAFMRRDFGEENLQVAIKCAPMNDPHHGHLDAGSFILSWQGDILVGEMDQKVYDQFFFTEDRWKYLHVRSLSHNVVHVNGEEQIPCKHKDQPWADHFIGGKIEQFVVKDDYAYTLVNATQAYPGQELKGWKRWAILDKENNIVILLDEVKCAPGAEIDVLFHPNVEARRQDGVMTLKGERVDMEMVPLFKGDYTLKTGRQLHHQIVQSQATRWIPYYHILIEKAPAETNYIASVFYPTALKDGSLGAKQFTLEENGSAPVISCVVNGQTLRYTVSPEQVTLER